MRTGSFHRTLGRTTQDAVSQYGDAITDFKGHVAQSVAEEAAGRGGAKAAAGMFGFFGKFFRRGCRVPAPAIKTFEIDSRQLGKKLGKHTGDFGLDPSDAAHRSRIYDLINDIGRNPERSVPGTFRGQGPGGARGPVEFRIKGCDVVVTTPDGEFVTILKDGINNPSVVEAIKNVGG